MTTPSANSDGGVVYLSDRSPRDAKLDDKRAKVDQVRDLYNQGGQSRLGERLNFCSRFLSLAVVDGDDGSKLKLDTAMFCHVRLCPICQYFRSRMWIRRFKTALPNILEDNKSARFLLLTLTVRNPHIDDLNATIKHLNKSWDRLTHYKDFRHVLGYVRSLEVTREVKRNKKGEVIETTDYAHPHFHAILMVSSTYFNNKYYIKYEDWVRMWQKAARIDYHPSISVKAVKAKADTPDGEHPIYESLLEVLKYSVKDSELLTDSEWLIKLTEQLHRVRTKTLGGLFRQYLNEEELNNPTDDKMIHNNEEDKESLKDKPHILAGWKERAKRYQIIEPAD